MGFDREAIKRMFPNLAKELNEDSNKIAVNSVRTDAPTGEDASSKCFVHYSPDIIDFIRRCDTTEQAEEIIAYMEKKGEIERRYAEKLRIQLKEKGVPSFGTKKEHDYYLKHGEAQLHK
jgi:hypothetical protein